MLFKKKKYIKADYNLTYDNLAIPEIHTKKETIHTLTDPDEKPSISYDGVAIPEIHPKNQKQS